MLAFVVARAVQRRLSVKTSLSREAAWQLGRALRRRRTPSLARRRQAFVGTLVASGAMAGIGLYQLGVWRRLPEPEWRGLSAERVNGSAEAYRRFMTPDAVLGLFSYATTAVLVAAGGPERARTDPWLPIGAALKAWLDGAVAAKLTADQIFKFRAVCLWCVGAALANWTTAALTLPEARRATRMICRRAGLLGS